jgi:hypothetical protein
VADIHPWRNTSRIESAKLGLVSIGGLEAVEREVEIVGERKGM